MNLQIIKSVEGKDEYVLLPIGIYNALREQIKERMKNKNDNDYIPFVPSDYVDNPIALRRINAGLTQAELAGKMQVTQAYISKIESQEKVSLKLLNKIKMALKK